MSLMLLGCRRFLALAGSLVLAGGLGAQARPATRALAVVATTDVHGHLRAWDSCDRRADSTRSLAAAATAVDSIRAAHLRQYLSPIVAYIRARPSGVAPPAVDRIVSVTPSP